MNKAELNDIRKTIAQMKRRNRAVGIKKHIFLSQNRIWIV